MFSCPTCSKSFTRQDNLRRHLTTHDAASQHTCPTCAQSFHRLTNLRRHERSVHGPAKHICETCGERFNFLHQLRRHEQTHCEHTCPMCAQSFHSLARLQHHERSVHPKHVCETCGDRFSQVRQLRRHQQIHRERTCPLCARTFRSVAHLQRHEGHHHGLGMHICKTCGERFKYPRQLRHHQQSHGTPNETSATTLPIAPPVDRHPSVQIASPLPNQSPVDNHPPVLPEVNFTNDPLEVPSDICSEADPVSEAYRRHWSMIRHCFQRGRPLLDVYNFRLTDIAQLSNYVDAIFTDQIHAFKLNLGFGYLLRHKETDQLRYYYPSANVRVFDQPFTVDNHDSLDTVLAQVEQLDPLEWARLQRPNTKWTVERVTNVTFFVAKLSYHLFHPEKP